MHQASTDYYTRSISQDSIDGSPPVLRASSVDRYYTAQDVIVPSTTSISPLFSNSADMSLVLNSNCDEPPSSHQGVRIKVLRPIYKDPNLLEGYKEEKRCRETAMLLRNGMETNLIGRMECKKMIKNRTVSCHEYAVDSSYSNYILVFTRIYKGSTSCSS